MNVPILTGLTDLVYLQNAITLLLLADSRIQVPVIPEIKLIMENDQSVEALWTLPQSAFTVTPQGVTINATAAPGSVGAGLLVEMPEATAESPGVSGSPLTWGVNIVCFEERNTNFLAGTGSLITSEQYAELCLDMLQHQWIYGFGTLEAKRNIITPAHDWMNIHPGILAYRASFRATIGRIQSTRSASATPTISTGTCTITCTDNSATIYYTIDGSMPVSSNVNSSNPAGIGATVYTAPFAVNSGTTVLCASQKTGLITSQVTGIKAP
jgi:hypothetical protein